MSHSNLSREQSRALEIFLQSLATEDEITIEEITLPDVTSHDNRFFVPRPIQTSDLPREPNWIWNQSRGRKEVNANSEITVKFFKLNTRKSKSIGDTTSIPQFKIWVFNVMIEQTEKTFVWCEKGENPTLDENLLAQLSFLMPYVSLNCAEECGWGFRIAHSILSAS